MATWRRIWALGLSALAGTMLVTACATGDGRTLRPPTVPAPTSAPTTVGDVDPDSLDGDNMTLPGPQVGEDLRIAVPWVPGAEIDSRFTCAGASLSPSVAWEAVPADAAELALVVTDQGGRVHWMLLGIDPRTVAIPEGVSTEELRAQQVEVLTNSFGDDGWTAPCPAEGDTEILTVKVHALSQQIEGATTLDLAEIVDLLGFLSVGMGEATGVAVR